MTTAITKLASKKRKYEEAKNAPRLDCALESLFHWICHKCHLPLPTVLMNIVQDYVSCIGRRITIKDQPKPFETEPIQTPEGYIISPELMKLFSKEEKEKKQPLADEQEEDENRETRIFASVGVMWNGQATMCVDPSVVQSPFLFNEVAAVFQQNPRDGGDHDGSDVYHILCNSTKGVYTIPINTYEKFRGITSIKHLLPSRTQSYPCYPMLLNSTTLVNFYIVNSNVCVTVYDLKSRVESIGFHDLNLQTIYKPAWPRCNSLYTCFGNYFLQVSLEENKDQTLHIIIIRVDPKVTKIDAKQHLHMMYEHQTFHLRELLPHDYVSTQCTRLLINLVDPCYVSSSPSSLPHSWINFDIFIAVNLPFQKHCWIKIH